MAWLSGLAGIRGRLVSGSLLVGFSQVHLLAPGWSSFLGSQAIFSIPLSDERLALGIPNSAGALVSCLLLLAGSLLLASAFKDMAVIQGGNEAAPGFDKSQGFFNNLRLGLGLIALALNAYLLWQLHEKSEAPALLGIWLLSIGLFGWLCLQRDRQQHVFLGPALSKTDVLWLGGLFLTGLLIGMYRLQALPGQLIPDETPFWVKAAGIATGRLQPSPFDSGVYSFPIASSMAQAFILKMFGASLWSWRFASLLAGLLGLIPLYLLARELFGRQVAIVSGAVMLSGEYFLAFSRLGYNSSQTLFPVTLALYFLVLAIRRHSTFLFYLAGAAAGLGFYTYTAGRSALVIIALFILVLFVQRRKDARGMLKALAVLGLGWYLFSSPLLVFSSVSHPGSAYSKLEENAFFHTSFATQFFPLEEIARDPTTILSSDGTLFFNPRVYAWLVTRGLVRTLLSFELPDVQSGHFISAPLAGFAGAIFFTIGLAISLRAFSKPRHLLLLCWFAVNVLLLSTFNVDPPRASHMLSVIPLLALWTGLGLVACAGALAQVHPGPGLRTAITAALTLIISMAGLYSYFVLMPAIYRPAPEQILSWAGLYAQDEKIVYVYADPAQYQPKPDVMLYFRKNLVFRSLPLDQLATELNGKTALFFPAQIAAQVEPTLASAWQGPITRRTFYTYEGLPTLAAAANFPADFGAPTDAAGILRDSYLRPGLWLAAFVLAFLIFVAFFPSAGLEHAPGPLRSFAVWLTRAAPGEDGLDG